MDGLKLNEHERAFNVKPIGIKYICEFCNEGEQICTNKSPIIVEKNGVKIPNMREHKCSKCGKIMMLPKSYPYVEFIPLSEEHLNDDGK